MTTLNIEGKRVTVDDSFLSLSPEEQEATVNEIARQMGVSPTDAGKAPPGPARDRSIFQALTSGSQAGLMMGFDDEIGAAMLAPVDATIDYFRGDGFDLGRAYNRKREILDAQKDQMREAHPIAHMTGEVAGGMALGGGARRGGQGVLGLGIAGKGASRAAQLATTGVEAGLYGAGYGAGEADPGERIQGAAEGFATGATVGTGVSAALSPAARYINKIISRPAGKLDDAASAVIDEAGDTVSDAISRKASSAAKAESSQLFNASENSGVRFVPQAVSSLGKRLKLAAGRINDKLRPKTAGYADEIDAVFNGEMSLEDFEEFRQVLGKEMKGASENDARTLGAMKRVLDNFADNAKSTDLTGDVNGVKLLRAARAKWATAKKTEIIESIIDLADVKSGRYTQSGVANTIREKMSGLYKQIQDGKVKGFSDEEVSMIRQMAKGGSDSKILNTLAKFAPRGPVSITLGQVIGGIIPGGNIAVPIAGAAAAAAKDRAAISGAETLIEVIGGRSQPKPNVTLSGTKGAPSVGIGVTSGKDRLKERLYGPQ